MKVVSKVIDLSLPPLASSEVDEKEVPQHQSLAQSSEGQAGPSESKGPPTNRLKLVFKRGQTPREVLPTDSLTRRPVRAVKQPTVPPTAEAPGAANQQPRGSRKKDTGIVCVKCNRGNSPATNMIVFCDGCNRTWHQKCHDPPIDDKVVRDKKAEWHCKECKPEPTPAPPASGPAPKSKTGRAIHPRLKKAPRLDVGGNQFSPDETRAYLSSLSHAALVELVVNVSSQNPTVAMFPANMRDLPATAFPVPSAQPDTTTTTAPKQKKRSRTASTAKEDPSEDRSVPPRKRARTTSAPAPSRKRTRATSAATEKPAEADPAEAAPPRKRARTTSAPAKPPAPAAPPKSRKASTSSRRQASAQPAAPKKSTRRSKDKPAKARPPPRSTRPPPKSTRDTSTDLSEPKTTDISDDDFFDEDDHRTYPEPGKGLFPAAPDPPIPELLKENPDCPSISHALHGPAKLDRELGRPPRVWGPATST